MRGNERLEPDCTNIKEGHLRSMAISAKRQADAIERIADVVCGDERNTGLLGYLDMIAGRP